MIGKCVVIFYNSRTDNFSSSVKIFSTLKIQPDFFIAFNLSFNAWIGANFRPFVQTLNSSLSPQ
jgi:hypothetical protein